MHIAVRYCTVAQIRFLLATADRSLPLRPLSLELALALTFTLTLTLALALAACLLPSKVDLKGAALRGCPK